jgi:hypothetical protein
MKLTTKRKIIEPVSFSEDGSGYDPFTHGVTYSLLSRWLECPEKFRLGYVDLWTPLKVSGAMSFGSIGHAALEHIYSSGAMEGLRGAGMSTVRKAEAILVDRLSRFMATAYAEDRQKLERNTTGDPNEMDELEETYGVAHITLDAYCREWVTDYREIDWIDLEREFAFPYALKDGRRITIKVKIDGAFNTQSKALWLFETKFKGRIDEDAILDKMPYDLQVQLYMWAMEVMYGRKPEGVMYNVVRRSQLRRKQSERRNEFHNRIREDIKARPEFYFMRHNVSFYEDEIRRARVEIGKIIEAFVSAWENRFFFRNSGACDARGKCFFINVCSRGMAKGLYRRDKIFAELETV